MSRILFASLALSACSLLSGCCLFGHSCLAPPAPCGGGCPAPAYGVSYSQQVQPAYAQTAALPAAPLTQVSYAAPIAAPAGGCSSCGTGY